MQNLALVVALLTCFISAWASQTAPGKYTGGERYDIPAWFKDSFLDIAEDATEAGESDKHLLLFMHLDGCPYCATMMRESFIGSDFSPWLRKRFDSVAINVKGDREIAFNKDLTVTEKELARALKVNYTPAIVFLNAENQQVFRADGYRASGDFHKILRYVDAKAYQKQDLATYLREQAQEKLYAFRSNPQFVDTRDLSDVGDKPLLVVFEDKRCASCNKFHDNLNNARIVPWLERLTVVRLDADDTAPLTAPDGSITTPRAFARQLNLSYRPGSVLFDRGAEVARIDNLLRVWHLHVVLRYVSERHFRKYPTWLDFGRVYRAQTLAAGQDIDLSE